MKKQKQSNKTEKKRIYEKMLKYLTLVYVIIISITFIVNYNQTFDEKVNLNGDNIHYFSLGKALSEGKGFSNTMGLLDVPHTHFPPGYPFFISCLMKCGINSIHGIKVANGFLLYASLILLYFILSHFAKNRAVAFVAVFFTTLHSSLLGLACIMMSEMLFILLACVVLLIILYYPPDKLFVDKRKRLKDILIIITLAICLSYIYLIRVMGLTLILAVIAYFGVFTIQKLILFLKDRKNQELVKQNRLSFYKYSLVLLVAIASLLVPKTAWDMRDKSIGKKSDPYTSEYLGKKNGGKMETLEDWKVRVKNNGSNYIAKYIPSSVLLYKIEADSYPSESGKYPSTKEWILGILFLILLLFSVVKSQNGLILFFYVGITLLVLLGWQEQYGGYRYMTPIMPFLIFLFFNGVDKLVAFAFQPIKQIKHAIPQIVVLFICAYFMYPNYIKAQNELRATAKIKSWEKSNDVRMTNYLAACRFCKENLPDTVRVIARKPEVFYMFSGYRKSSNFPRYAEPDTIMSFLKRQKATHLIIDDWFRHAYVTLLPAVRANPEKFKVLKEIGKVDTAAKLNPTYVLEFNDEWGYYGERIDGKKTGEGYEFFQDGRKYAGHYENNSFNGFGTFYDKNGEVLYKGYWRNGIIIKGEGALNFNDGRKYVGEFSNNVPEGSGTLYDADGKIINKGKWRNGAFVSES